ncbi:MAG: TolC family protein [Candidatus Lernaella stagnicola]|nr:TolC family protein [Candidatus Lernaella stagnicola]
MMHHGGRFWFACLSVCAILAALAVDAARAAENDLLPLRLTIEKAVELALSHNESVRIADESINEAKGTYREYAADAFPQISGVVGYTRHLERRFSEVDMTAFNPLLAQMGAPPLEKSKQYFNSQHEWDFRLMAEQNLFTFGKVSNAIRLGSVFKKIARENKQLAVKDVALQTRQSFLTVLFAQEALSVAESNLKLTKETYDVVRNKAKQGVMSRFDLLIVESELAMAEPTVMAAERNLETAKQALLHVIGEPLDRTVSIVGELKFESLEGDVSEFVRRAVLQRPELRALSLQKDMYDYSHKIARALYLPTLTANATYAQSGGSDKQIWPEDEPGDASDGFQPSLNFGVQLYVPLFDGLRAYGRMKQMAAKRQTSRLQIAQATRGIKLEVTSLAKQIRTTEAMVAANMKAVEVAAEANHLAQLRFENGLGTRLEVTDARNNLNRAKLGLAATLFDLNDARARLQRAMGE